MNYRYKIWRKIYNEIKNKEEELSNRLQSLINDKNKLIKTIKEYISPEYMNTFLNYILELPELFDLNVFIKY